MGSLVGSVERVASPGRPGRSGGRKSFLVSALCYASLMETHIDAVGGQGVDERLKQEALDTYAAYV